MSKLKTMLFITVMSLAAASVANILINPLVQDIFKTCIESTSPEPSVACEYGTQVIYAGLAGLFLIVFSLVFGTNNRLFPNKLSAMMTGPAYLIARIMVWRLYLRLPERGFPGVDEGKGIGDYFRDYVDVSFLIVCGAVAAVITMLYVVSSDPILAADSSENDSDDSQKQNNNIGSIVRAVALLAIAGTGIAAFLSRPETSENAQTVVPAEYSFSVLLYALPILLTALLALAIYVIRKETAMKSNEKTAMTTKTAEPKTASKPLRFDNISTKAEQTKGKKTANQSTTKKTTTKKAPAKKTPTKKKASSTKKTTAKKAPAKKTATKKASSAKKTASKSSSTKKASSAKKTTSKKAPAKKTTAKKK